MKLTDLFSRDRSQKKTAVAAKDELPSDAKSEQLEMRQNTSNDERLAAAKERHKQGGITEAEAVYRNILEIDPEHADARHMVGIVCLGRGEASEAEQHFRQAIALDDKQSVYYSNLGSALGAQNRTAEALDCFTRALDLNPENLGALSNAATALLSIGRANEAKPLCLKILAMQPDNVGARLNLAAAYIEEHEIHAGITVLREGLAIQPHNVDLLFQLASALEFVNQLDEASAVIEKLEALEFGLTYQAVMGLWLHYRSYLGDSWLEYRYESLVENFDETVTEVLDFIGVGWHEDIAHYRQAAKKRVITTPSYRDVTGPVNSRALDRWRRYEQELAPILPLLEPFVDVFGYSK